MTAAVLIGGVIAGTLFVVRSGGPSATATTTTARPRLPAALPQDPRGRLTAALDATESEPYGVDLSGNGAWDLVVDGALTASVSVGADGVVVVDTVSDLDGTYVRSGPDSWAKTEGRSVASPLVLLRRAAVDGCVAFGADPSTFIVAFDTRGGSCGLTPNVTYSVTVGEDGRLATMVGSGDAVATSFSYASVPVVTLPDPSTLVTE